MGEGLSADECSMLSWFEENDWESSSLPQLRILGNGADPSQVPRLQRALRSLLKRRAITLRRLNDTEQKGILSEHEARSVIDDFGSWRTYWEPGFDGEADYFEAVPTREAKRLFRACPSEQFPWKP